MYIYIMYIYIYMILCVLSPWYPHVRWLNHHSSPKKTPSSCHSAKVTIIVGDRKDATVVVDLGVWSWRDQTCGRFPIVSDVIWCKLYVTGLEQCSCHLGEAGTWWLAYATRCLSYGYADQGSVRILTSCRFGHRIPGNSVPNISIRLLQEDLQVLAKIIDASIIISGNGGFLQMVDHQKWMVDHGTGY